MKRLVIVCGGVLACVATGCASEDAETKAARAAVAKSVTVAVTPGILSHGRTTYRRYCVQCHGYYGKGDGTSSASFDPPPRDHTDAAVMKAIPDLVIAETIRLGGAGRGFPNMPAFPHVGREELVALVAYVRSLSVPDLASVQIGDIE